MRSLIFWAIFLYFILLIFLHSNIFTVENLINDEWVLNLRNVSYFGMILKIKELGYDYSLFQYAFESSILSCVLGILAYMTTKSIALSLVLVLISTFLLPYYHFLATESLYKYKIEQDLFLYVTSSLVYLREDTLTSLEIMMNCLSSLSSIVQTDLQKTLNFISSTSQFEEGLDMFEKKYCHSIVKNLHIILKAKYNEGALNLSLYEYLYDNVESYELLNSEFIKKSKANRSLFYFMILLEFLAIYLVVNVFGNSQFINLESTFFKMVIFIYYLLNIITVLFYEGWCRNHLQTE